MTAITSTPISTTASGAATIGTAVDNTMIASNFTTFLQLLTTQLKNQNPLDPLDTNQFTQQLVQFAQVEQTMKSNDSLSTLVTMEKAAQSTTALALVGATVVVDGSTTQLANNQAFWSLTATKPATATVTIKDATGQTTALSTQIQARVDSVDLTQNPPLLSINGQTYTMTQLQKIVAPGTI